MVTLEAGRLEMVQEFFVNWYRQFGRSFPWRSHGTSPFVCLVTEMLLRQTRAAHVANIWDDFFRKYPSAKTLMDADPDELMRDVQVLGFGRQRSEALRTASRWLCLHHGGEVPATESELIAIPHVGAYTARAVLCFAYNQPVAIVDTNILRFFSRYHGIELRRLDNRRAPRVWELATAALPQNKEHVREHNYGLLDFTAAVCKPRNPSCTQCPLVPSCTWGKHMVD